MKKNKWENVLLVISQTKIHKIYPEHTEFAQLNGHLILLINRVEIIDRPTLNALIWLNANTI